MSEAKPTIEELFHHLNTRPQAIRDTLIEHLRHEHPTLQQNFWRMVAEVAEAYNRGNSYTDERNEASKRLTKAIVRAIQEKDIRLPFI